MTATETETGRFTWPGNTCDRIVAYLAAHPGLTAYELGRALRFGGGNMKTLCDQLRDEGLLASRKQYRPHLGREASLWYVAPVTTGSPADVLAGGIPERDPWEHAFDQAEAADVPGIAALATSKAARAAVPVPTLLAPVAVPGEPGTFAQPERAAIEAPEGGAGVSILSPGYNSHLTSRDLSVKVDSPPPDDGRCETCGYLLTWCCCPGGPRGGAL